MLAKVALKSLIAEKLRRSVPKRVPRVPPRPILKGGKITGFLLILNNHL